MNPFHRRLTTDIPMIEAATLEWMLSADLDVRSAEHPALANFRKQVQPQMELRGDTAIIPIHGVLARRPDPFEQAFLGVEDSVAIYNLVTAAIANPDVHGLLLHLDSPGGMHTGGPEIADAIWNSPKPVVAFGDGAMASLAYLIGSQADEIVTTTSTVVGSIGSFIAVPDFSRLFEANGVKMNVVRNDAGKFKGIGVHGAAVTEEQLAYLKDRAEASFQVFRKAVQRARPQVPADAMQGQWFSGAEGRKLGLVDRIGDMNFALSVLRSHIRRTK